ncbi:MAG: ATP-binding protein, partial [Clostridiaceae bacterium]
LKRSNLPPKKTLKEFDFGFQRSVTREQMLRLTDCSWIDEAFNIMFLGPPSVGNYRKFFVIERFLLHIPKFHRCSVKIFR